MFGICYFSNLLFNRVFNLQTWFLALRQMECGKNFVGFSSKLFLLLLYSLNAETDIIF